MGMRINNSVDSLMAMNSLVRGSSQLGVSLTRLSTGESVGRGVAAQDFAALTSTQTNRMRTLMDSARNTQEGISACGAADGATAAVGGLLERMRGLARQASSTEDNEAGAKARAIIQTELDELVKAVDNAASQASFGGKKLLDGSLADAPLQFQTGSDPQQTVSVSLTGMSAKALGLDKLSLASHKSTAEAMSSVEAAQQLVAGQRQSLHETKGRLEAIAQSLGSVGSGAPASAPRIRDTDFAVATAQLTRAQLLVQPALGIAAQANLRPELLASLLR